MRPIPIPADWAFLVAHSLVTAEKSGAAREDYNARRTAGTARSSSWASPPTAAIKAAASRISESGASAACQPRTQRDSFPPRHHRSPPRAQAAVGAMERARCARASAGSCSESHASLRDRLQVSCPALDRLVDAAMESRRRWARASPARASAVAPSSSAAAESRRSCAAADRALLFHAPGFREDKHLLDADAGPGAVRELTPDRQPLTRTRD